MSALPPSQMRAMRDTAKKAVTPVNTMARRWEKLHAASEELASIAGLSPEEFAGDVAAFPAMLEGASEWQRTMAWQGIEDIDAMMGSGLSALATVTARGQDASAPAQALWREFHHAREAVLALVQPAAAA